MAPAMHLICNAMRRLEFSFQVWVWIMETRRTTSRQGRLSLRTRQWQRRTADGRTTHGSGGAQTSMLRLKHIKCALFFSSLIADCWTG